MPSKSDLYEVIAKAAGKWEEPKYNSFRTGGTDNRPIWACKLTVFGETFNVTGFPDKKSAEESASAKALQFIDRAKVKKIKKPLQPPIDSEPIVQKMENLLFIDDEATRARSFKDNSNNSVFRSNARDFSFLGGTPKIKGLVFLAHLPNSSEFESIKFRDHGYEVFHKTEFLRVAFISDAHYFVLGDSSPLNAFIHIEPLSRTQQDIVKQTEIATKAITLIAETFLRESAGIVIFVGEAPHYKALTTALENTPQWKKLTIKSVSHIFEIGRDILDQYV